LRFWAAGSKLGEDLNYQEKDLISGKRFITKLLNASKFVFMNLKGYNGKKKPKKLEKVDRLFLTKLGWMVQKVTESFEKYEYSKVKLIAENFFWSDFCDNYLEIVKKRVYQGKGNKKLSAQYTLYKTLLTLIKLFAPITPFITEEIYQNYFKKFEKDKSVHVSDWPKPELKQKDLDSLCNFTTFTGILVSVRKWKSTRQKPMNAEIILTILNSNMKGLKDMLEDLKNVTNAKEIKEGKQFRVDFL